MIGGLTHEVIDFEGYWFQRLCLSRFGICPVEKQSAYSWLLTRTRVLNRAFLQCFTNVYTIYSYKSKNKTNRRFAKGQSSRNEAGQVSKWSVHVFSLVSLEKHFHCYLHSTCFLGPVNAECIESSSSRSNIFNPFYSLAELSLFGTGQNGQIYPLVTWSIPQRFQITE